MAQLSNVGPNVNQQRYVWYRNGWKQKPVRFDLINPLAQHQLRTVVAEIVGTWYSNPSVAEDQGLIALMQWTSGGHETYDESKRAMNRALAKFDDKIGPQSSLGVAIATWSEAHSMLTNRMIQLAGAARSLFVKRRLDWFVEDLGVKRLPKHKSLTRVKSRECAGLWLEYWFGWSASVGDIYAAVDVLQQQVPSFQIDGKGFAKRSYARWDNPGNGYFTREGGQIRIHAKVGAEVFVTNPNLYLANSLGLINPATVALDLIPFSWLVNWFVNINQFVNSWSKYLGLELRNPYHTIYCVLENGERWSGYSHIPTKTFHWNRTNSHGYCVKRRTGIPGVSLIFTSINRLSWTRAATAASLLVSLFINDRKPKGLKA